MEKINGISINFSLLRDLVKVSDLIYFEGPLLSHFQSKSGEHYLYYWVDADDIYNRWLIFRVSYDRLQLYLNGTVSLFQLIQDLDNNFIFKADIDNDLKYHSIELLYTYELPPNYLPQESSFYNQKNTTTINELKGYSKILNQGIFQAYFNNSVKVGYGTIDADLFSNSLFEISNITKGLRKSFIGDRRKANNESADKKNKINIAQLKSASTLEYIGNTRNSFGALLKPVNKNVSIFNEKTLEDYFVEYVIQFYESSTDIEQFKVFASKLDKSVIDSYRRLLKTITAAKTQFNLNWVNEVSNFSKTQEISYTLASEILNNLEKLEFKVEEDIKITGKFIALNLKTGWYQFEDFEDEENISSGHLDNDRLQVAYNINWQSIYDVIIKRSEETKTGNKKPKIIDTIVSFIEITNENK